MRSRFRLSCLAYTGNRARRDELKVLCQPANRPFILSSSPREVSVSPELRDFPDIGYIPSKRIRLSRTKRGFH
jgi:hypothetical protein